MQSTTTPTRTPTPTRTTITTTTPNNNNRRGRRRRNVVSNVILPHDDDDDDDDDDDASLLSSSSSVPISTSAGTMTSTKNTTNNNNNKANEILQHDGGTTSSTTNHHQYQHCHRRRNITTTQSTTASSAATTSSSTKSLLPPHLLGRRKKKKKKTKKKRTTSAQRFLRHLRRWFQYYFPTPPPPQNGWIFIGVGEGGLSTRRRRRKKKSILLLMMKRIIVSIISAIIVICMVNTTILFILPNSSTLLLHRGGLSHGGGDGATITTTEDDNHQYYYNNEIVGRQRQRQRGRRQRGGVIDIDKTNDNIVVGGGGGNTRADVATTLRPEDMYDYDEIYKSNGTHEFYKTNKNNHQIDYYHDLLSNYTSKEIMTNGCELTVVLMDPRLPTSKTSAAVWFALESVSAYTTNQTCILLQTSCCEVGKNNVNDSIKTTKKNGNNNNNKNSNQRNNHQNNNDNEYEYDDDKDDDDEYNKTNNSNNYINNELLALKLIYEKSLPLFRQKILDGNVRVTFLDHVKYKFQSCSNFYNPSNAMMNINYWGNDEFLPHIDSDLVLIIQDDAVLCHHINPKLYQDVAYVGSPWPKQSHLLNPEPIEGMCLGIPNRWKRWIFNKGRYKKEIDKWNQLKQTNKNDNNGDNGGDDGSVLKMPEILNPNLPQPICDNDDNKKGGVGTGVGPIGNGGLSIRSRKWLIKAIQTCPHYELSGINITKTPLSCKVIDYVAEDFYFAVVLRGINAPFPTIYEASLFSVESLWPEDVEILYYGGGGGGNGDGGSSGGGTLSEEEKIKFILKRWGKKNGIKSYNRMHDLTSYYNDGNNNNTTTENNNNNNLVTIPIGMHKIWYYQPNEILLGKQVLKECKFLKYLFDPNKDSKWINNTALVEDNDKRNVNGKNVDRGRAGGYYYLKDEVKQGNQWIERKDLINLGAAGGGDGVGSVGSSGSAARGILHG